MLDLLESSARFWNGHFHSDVVETAFFDAVTASFDSVSKVRCSFPKEIMSNNLRSLAGLLVDVGVVHTNAPVSMTATTMSHCGAHHAHAKFAAPRIEGRDGRLDAVQELDVS